MTLTRLIARSASAHGRGVALVDGARSLTYAELEERVGQVAATLAARGMGRGDRLVNWLPNGIDWLLVTLAGARLGLVCPLVNTRYRSSELDHVLGTVAARGIVYEPDFLGIDFAAVLAATGRSVEHVLAPADLGDTGHPAPAAGRADDLVILFPTSGTTSSPKLAGHDQRGVVLHAVNDARAFDIRPGDRMLLSLPLCGAFGFAGAMAALGAGATLVLQPVFEPSDALGLLERHRVTHFYGSDAMLRAVLQAAGDDRRPFASWRWGCHANFGGRPAELVRQVREQAGVRIHGTYGSSECFALMARWPADAPDERRALSGGFPVGPDIAVRVRDPQTGQPVPDGEPGELQIRGYNVTTGYFANPAASAAAFSDDGWYRSGDLGYREPDGSFVFLSRIKDSLRVRGYLVDPLEIEEELERHPAVEVAQVVGVSAEGEGEVPVAYVRLAPGSGVVPDELTAFCARRLASYKVPRLIRVLAEFPVVDGPNGRKIQKTRLREMAEEDLS